MVNIQIQKKDLWLLSAIMVFLVGVAVVIAYGSGDSTIHGHDAGEVEQIGFGGWDTTDAGQIGGTGATLVKSTTYQAATNGFVVSYTSTLNGVLNGFTDSIDASTQRALDVSYISLAGANFIMPVKKGDFWRVTDSAGDPTIYWISLG